MNKVVTQTRTTSPSDIASLNGRVALVTGAGSGIGQAGALAMARCGAHGGCIGSRWQLGRECIDEILTEGHHGSSRQLDVSDDDALEAAILEAAEELGRLDILHSHAGIQVEGTLEQVAPEGLDASWAINVRAHFIAARTAIQPMKRQGGGSIIITASNSCIQYDRGMTA